MDIYTPAKRSWLMSRIRGVNTMPEKVVRSFLHAHGLRFRLHLRNLPGKPDIVLRRHATVVFVHGCFWHHHRGCANAIYPKTRSEFWRTKIDGNVKRDKKTDRRLRDLGWRVITVWECEVSRALLLTSRLAPLLRSRKHKIALQG
jgi:DNA mismatch endonuclease, patch repair protein